MITIDGTPIKTPADFNVERYNLTKPGRTADGTMHMDLIAKKRKLVLTYEVISGAEMETILKLIDSDKMFFPVTYEDHKGPQTITCYAGAIPTSYYRRNMGWYYRNVQFSLIQQ